MAVWIHFLERSRRSSVYHLATHDREGCGDGRPIFSEYQTRHGFSLCGRRIDDDFEDIFSLEEYDEHDPDHVYLCDHCVNAWKAAERSPLDQEAQRYV